MVLITKKPTWILHLNWIKKFRHLNYLREYKLNAHGDKWLHWLLTQTKLIWKSWIQTQDLLFSMEGMRKSYWIWDFAISNIIGGRKWEGVNGIPSDPFFWPGENKVPIFGLHIWGKTVWIRPSGFAQIPDIYECGAIKRDFEGSLSFKGFTSVKKKNLQLGYLRSPRNRTNTFFPVKVVWWWNWRFQSFCWVYQYDCARIFLNSLYNPTLSPFTVINVILTWFYSNNRNASICHHFDMRPSSGHFHTNFLLIFTIYVSIRENSKNSYTITNTRTIFCNSCLNKW